MKKRKRNENDGKIIRPRSTAADTAAAAAAPAYTAEKFKITNINNKINTKLKIVKLLNRRKKEKSFVCVFVATSRSLARRPCYAQATSNKCIYCFLYRLPLH